MSKQRIKLNVWGNWNGYKGNKKVIEFGCDERAANDWLKDEASYLKEKQEAAKKRISFCVIKADEEPVRLNPCPYCGEPVKLDHTNWIGFPKVQCGNYGKWINGEWHKELGCKVRPSTFSPNNFETRYAGMNIKQIENAVCEQWNRGEFS